LSKYEIFFSSAAERYFKKLKERPLKNAYKEALTAISTDPYCGTPKHGDLAGIYSCDMKYQGVSYEIAYTIHDSNGKKIVVVLAGTRENFYEQLKKYIR
jgi:mRNA interferase RelE/StbE